MGIIKKIMETLIELHLMNNGSNLHFHKHMIKNKKRDNDIFLKFVWRFCIKSKNN